MGDWGRACRPVRLLMAITAVAITAGCTACAGESRGDSTATRLTPGPTVTMATQPSNSDVQQRNDLRDERLTSWDSYQIVSERSIRVYFWSSDLKCAGSRATVAEDATTVRISLFTGTLPDAPIACPADAVQVSLLLTTHDPIGTRSVVSG